jgi:hypothetical protein
MHVRVRNREAESSTGPPELVLKNSAAYGDHDQKECRLVGNQIVLFWAHWQYFFNRKYLSADVREWPRNWVVEHIPRQFPCTRKTSRLIDANVLDGKTQPR